MKRKAFLPACLSLAAIMLLAPAGFALSAVPVKAIYMNRSQTPTLAVGETLGLIAWIDPENATNRTVRWSSSNGRVAGVNAKGVVAARSAGKAVITVKSGDGKASAILEIKVVKTAPKTITISWFGAAMPEYLSEAFTKDPVSEELARRTRIRIDHTYTLGMTERGPKVAAMLAADDLPDVVTIIDDDGNVPQVIKAKAAIPLDGLVAKYGPDIARVGKTMIKFSKQSFSDDTHALYFIQHMIGQGELAPGAAAGWMIRWDLYKKQGYPKVKSYDDLLGVLGMMQKEEPVNRDGKKTYAVGQFMAESWSTAMLTQTTGTLSCQTCCGCYGVQYDGMIDNCNLRIDTGPDKAYAKALRFYNKAYRMGIMDPESATLKYQTFAAKFNTGRYMSYCNTWWCQNAEAYLNRGNKENDKGYAPIPFDINEKRVALESLLTKGNNWSTFITKKCKYPDRVIQLINYLCTPEGTELTYYGVEGKDNTYVRDGRLEYTRERIDSGPQFTTAATIMKYGVGMYTPGLNFLAPDFQTDARGVKINIASSPYNAEMAFSKMQKDYMKHFGYKNMQGMFEIVPEDKRSFNSSDTVGFELPPGSEIADIADEINSYISANETEVMFQKTEADFEKKFTAFVDGIKKLGVQKIIDVWTVKHKEQRDAENK